MWAASERVFPQQVLHGCIPAHLIGWIHYINLRAEENTQKEHREIAEEIGELPPLKKTLPLESFLSNDKKFLFHTYLCIVEEEFIPQLNKEHDGFAWCSFTKWPKPLHHGLRNTLQSKINLSKLETVFQTINLLDK